MTASTKKEQRRIAPGHRPSLLAHVRATQPEPRTLTASAPSLIDHVQARRERRL